MANSDLAPLVETLHQARVLCIGDVMLDNYVYGSVDRVSPEAPIPVLQVEREVSRLGGAGNVLANLHALGAQAAFISVVGNDRAGRQVSHLIGELEGSEAHMLVERGRVTTVKTRYVAETQQLLRADRESVTALGKELRDELLQLVNQSLSDYPVVIVSDYAKGALSDGVAGAAIAAARNAGARVIVDPKSTDYSRYAGASVLKPNRRELAIATGSSVATEAEVVAAARGLIDAHEFGAVLVSLGRDGMMLVEAEGEPRRMLAAAREVYDVSGAGDTVIATLATALGAGADLGDAARLANLAAGIVVGKVGTAVVYREELSQALAGIEGALDDKAPARPAALDQIARWRRNGLKVGFTNGCFDLLHPGHVSLLAEARKACDRLVVGLNSDGSVARLKGPTRPVQSEAARAAVLASLASVDLVMVFDEDTPLDLIGLIRPDVLVKGADYRRDQVVGGDLVESWGGKVVLASILPGHSTTATIAKLAR